METDIQTPKPSSHHALHTHADVLPCVHIMHKHALTALFLAFLAILGCVALNKTFMSVGNLLAGTTKGFIAFRDEMDATYSEMLTTTGNPFPLIHKGAYININGLMARVMGQRVVNERVLLANGNLADVVKELTNKNYEKTINSVRAIASAQWERGGYYLFVITPDKISKYGETGLPVGSIDYYNANFDRIRKGLEKEGIPVLDLRDAVVADELDYTSLHYKTDHHWTGNTGLWAAGKILDYLERANVVDDISSYYLDKNSFENDHYEGVFLGSDGKRVGSTFAGVDDIDIPYPIYDTNISVQIIDNEIKEGTFRKVFTNQAYVADYFNKTSRGWTIGNNYYTVENKEAPIESKVLFYGDSYTSDIIPYASLCFMNIERVGFRYTKGVKTEDFTKYYNETQPDIVICVVSTQTDNNTYEFFAN
jgi:hypothetical protein